MRTPFNDRLFAALLSFCLLASANCFAAASPGVQPWGTTQDGIKVERVNLENDLGMKVSYIDYGATLTSMEVPDRQGKMQNIVLSLPDLAAYEKTKRKFASIIGRYAGRIGNARFELDGRTVELIPGGNGVTIHGGPPGYERRVWQRQDFSDAASLGSRYSLHSPDGDQHFPGVLDITVTYRLMRKSNEFRIEYLAVSSAPTVLNLTNHVFFNLAGAGASELATHRFEIRADRYAQTDAKKVPTGELLAVANTPLDFRKATGMMERLRAGHPLLGAPAGFDHALLFNHWTGKLALVAVIDEAGSGRSMQIRTTEPTVLLNSGNGFDGSETGSEGRAYQRYDGFAFETQHLPDSPNHAAFPSTVLRPGKTFQSTTSFRFSTLSSRQ